MLILIPSIH